MLILPDRVINDKIQKVTNEVTNEIIWKFIVPFALFSLAMMTIISYFLVTISTSITEPIIELQEKIKQIIQSHQQEKEILIQEQ